MVPELEEVVLAGPDGLKVVQDLRHGRLQVRVGDGGASFTVPARVSAVVPTVTVT